MSYADQKNPYANFQGTTFAISAGVSERTAFIRRTYAHLAGAVFAFMAIEVMIFQTLSEETLTRMAISMVSGWNWLLVLGAFFVVSIAADKWARSATSMPMQYVGLALYVVAEAVIFVPLLWFAQLKGGQSGQNIIGMAGLMTAVLFGGLTAVVFLTRADFSWLGKYLTLAALVALGFIICAVVFDLKLWDVFSGLMVALAAGYILYYTSNVLHHYQLHQHVAASLALFASVALLFWYILQLLMSRD